MKLLPSIVCSMLIKCSACWRIYFYWRSKIWTTMSLIIFYGGGHTPKAYVNKLLLANSAIFRLLRQRPLRSPRRSVKRLTSWQQHRPPVVWEDWWTQLGHTGKLVPDERRPSALSFPPSKLRGIERPSCSASTVGQWVTAGDGASNSHLKPILFCIFFP